MRKRKNERFNRLNLGSLHLDMSSQYELNVKNSGQINENNLTTIEFFDPPITENETLQTGFYKIQHGIKELNLSRADIFVSMRIFDEDCNPIDIF